MPAARHIGGGFAAAALLLALSTAPASAATGDNLISFDAVATAGVPPCGVGTGIAYDGANLLLSCWYSNVIERVNAATHLNAGAVTITGASNLAAMAWDATRSRLWACENYNTVMLIDTATGTVDNSVPGFSTSGCVDGLAYDGTDDTIWSSDDAAGSIQHYTTGGVLIASFPIGGLLGGCGNSGIAVGGPNLYLANNGCSQIYTLDKTVSSSSLFASSPARLEDLECDGRTFAAQNKGAIWSLDAYDRTLNAWEIAPGLCAFGGLGRCSDGILDPGEQCDDGNIASGDGCDANCQIEAPPGSGACCAAGRCYIANNGLCEIGTYQGDGTTCQDPGVCVSCGDGFVTGNEQCDDGNTQDGDGCDGNCQIEIPPTTSTSTSTSTSTTSTTLPTGACCMAGLCAVVTAGQCEVGTYQGDGTNCDNPGLCAVCGDGLVEFGEQCDDANTAGGDGCDRACRVEGCWTCSSGIQPSAPTHNPPTVSGLSICTHDDGATCDDGDVCTVGDTCSAGSCAGDAVVLQSACRWVMVGDAGVQSRTRGETLVTGHICGERARIGEFSLTTGDVVATRASGTGIQISGHAAVTGDIVTDGSGVSGKPTFTLLPGLATDVVAGGSTAVQSGDPSAIYDTTGTDSRIDDCLDAQADIASGKSLLNALPPGTDLGDTTVPAGSSLTLTATNPGGLNVFDFRSLATFTDATLVLDGNGNPGTIFVLRVQKRLDLRLRSKVVLAGGTTAGNVILYSQAKCRFGLEMDGAGTVFCPNGKLIMNARATWKGALIGGRGRVELRDSGVLTHVPLQVGP